MNVSDKIPEIRSAASLCMPTNDGYSIPPVSVMRLLCECALQFADILEAQEKAEPVATLMKNVNNFEGVAFTTTDWKRLGNLREGTKLYTHPPTTPTGVPQAPVVDERAEFETAYMKHIGVFGLGKMHFHWIQSDKGDVFPSDITTQSHWRLWQARAKLGRAVVPDEIGEGNDTRRTN